MNFTAVDLEVLETGDGKNPFEELITNVEKLNLQGRLDVSKYELEKTILFLERKYQDFSDFDSEKSKVLLQAMNANLLIFENQQSQSFVKIFENLKNLKNVALEIDDTNKIDYSQYLVSANIVASDDQTFYSYSSVLQQALTNIYATTIKTTDKEEWILELTFEAELENRHKSLEFIYIFIEALNTVKGVKVTLEDIKVGSLKVKLKIQFDNETSKKDVKDILDSSRQLVKRKIDSKQIIDKPLTNINESTVASTINIDSPSTQEAYKIAALEAAILEQKVERMKLENEEMKLSLLKERKIILKELISEGLIDQQDFEILISGMPFLQVKNGIVTVGENIDVIDNL